jgi:hypothetical protein
MAFTRYVGKFAAPKAVPALPQRFRKRLMLPLNYFKNMISKENTPRHHLLETPLAGEGVSEADGRGVLRRWAEAQAWVRGLCGLARGGEGAERSGLRPE